MLNDNKDEIMNMEELAALLRITETTAYQLVRSGEIPGRKVGREWRFLRRQVLDWLQPNVVYRDEWGGEYKVINGEEKIALWLPMSRSDKELLAAKAVSQNVKVSDLVAGFLKKWSQEN